MFDGKPEKVLRWIRNRARRIRQLKKEADAAKTIKHFENIINQFLREHSTRNTKQNVEKKNRKMKQGKEKDKNKKKSTREERTEKKQMEEERAMPHTKYEKKMSEEEEETQTKKQKKDKKEKQRGLPEKEKICHK